MSVEFTIDELKHLYDNFKKYDRNNDRQLSRKEILCLVQEEIVNATENEVDWFLAMIDVKVNNKTTIAINFAQYVRGMSEFAKVGSRIQFPSSSGIKNLIESGLLTLDLTGKKKGLNWKEVDRVYNQFERADKNNSGTLSYPEMVAVFRKVTPEIAYENYSEVYNKIDANKSGFVDFLEFLRWVIEAKITISLGNNYSKAAIAVKKHKKLEREKSKQSLKFVKLRSSSYALNQVQKPVETTREMRADAFKAFAAMDANADGELSETEFCKALGQVFKSLTKSELGRLYYIVDSDRSGSISFDEFLYAVAHETQVTKMAETMKHSYYASKFDWEIPFEELKIDTKIGEGNFGIVYKGTWHGTPVAIKKLKTQSIDDDVLEEFKKEVAILAKLRHPNIVLFMGACTQPDNLCIVTEYLSEGNVYSLLHKRNKKLAPQAIQKIAHQVALGLNYLHKHNIVHRDLKSLNLLMDDNQVCKLCDFGLSCLKPSDSCLTEQVGSPLWMSPELLNCKPYSEKVDVYSYAICIWECLTNKLPFDNLTFSQLVKSVCIMGIRPEIPSSCNPKLSALLKKCWESNPDKRPSVDDIIASLKEIS